VGVQLSRLKARESQPPKRGLWDHGANAVAEPPRDERAVAPRGVSGDQGTRAALEHKHTGAEPRGWVEGLRRESARQRSRVPRTQTTPLSVLGHGSERLTATPHSTITSARTSGTAGSSRRCRRIAVVRSNGRFATTRKASRGSSTVAALARPRRSPSGREGAPPSAGRARRRPRGALRGRAPWSAARRRRRGRARAPRGARERGGRSPQRALGNGGNVDYVRGPADAHLVRAARTRTIIIVVAIGLTR
jgi:hypothetical protein